MYLGIQEGFSVDNVEYLERELKFKPKLLVGEFSKKDREKCIKKKIFNSK